MVVARALHREAERPREDVEQRPLHSLCWPLIATYSPPSLTSGVAIGTQFIASSNEETVS